MPESENSLEGGNGKSAPGEWDGWAINDPIALQPGEPYVAHSALLDFAALWPTGTIQQLADKYAAEAKDGEPPKSTLRSIRTWTFRYRWRERLARYEELRFQELEARRMEQLASVHKEREQLASDLLKAGAGLVAWLNEALELGRKYPGTLKIKPSEVASVAQAAVKISFLVHGGSAEEANRERLNDETAMQLVDALHASMRRQEDAVDGEYREVPMLEGGTDETLGDEAGATDGGGGSDAADGVPADGGGPDGGGDG